MTETINNLGEILRQIRDVLVCTDEQHAEHSHLRDAERGVAAAIAHLDALEVGKRRRQELGLEV